MHGLEDDGELMVATFCPQCASREFGERSTELTPCLRGRLDAGIRPLCQKAAGNGRGLPLGCPRPPT